MNEILSSQLNPEDISSLDNLILQSIPFLNIEQIYQKVNQNNLDLPQFNRKFIEDRINTLLYTTLDHSNLLNSELSFNNLPLTEEEEFMIIFLAKYQDNTNASSLLSEFRYLFNYNHPFSSLVAQIEQNSSYNFNKQSSIIESYATTFAQLERIYSINEFTPDELESAHITQSDIDFISNSNDYVNDKSIPDYKVQINTNDPTYPIEELESNFHNLTQMLVKVFAFLQTKEFSIPIMCKNFLIGDADISSEVDFNLKLVEDYKPYEDKLILGLIMLKSDLNFYLENVGTGIIIIDGFQIWPGEITNLTNNSVIEMSGCDFVFCINYAFMNKLREITLKMANESESNDKESTDNKTKNEETNET